MEVVWHEAVAEALPVAPSQGTHQQPEKCLPIVVIDKDDLAVIPALPNVVDTPRQFGTRSTRHSSPKACWGRNSPLKEKGSVPF
jgi:hypothetical protein